jgi:hypothetical protein
MAKAPQDEVRTLTDACEPTIHLGLQLASVARSCRPKPLCDVTMAPLLRVHIRGIGWQPCHLQVGVCGDLCLDEHRPMRVQAIPDDDAHRPSPVPLAGAEGHQAIWRAKGVLNMALVSLAGERQANHRGQLPALAHASQARCLADGRPRGFLGFQTR